ncbi:FAD-dependent oxidoreductase [Janthinobacterium fluminis]|uniref:FAD-dependent oxidoreductase n=1 Tax=Janthinobacterium fluminis TaxID=2987524 RepID=A0ABT5K0L0_9BURK|nr:FAD-dependent oxidoreductase [Janthinobacterium fluminis]MDC8758235.1 FAD-dependent oxidoreductase [Janthinobacterium fluminis]
MEKDYQHIAYAYRRSDDEGRAAPVRRPVVIVGAGPVGLATAIDLAQQGVPVVLLDDDCRLSVGSRAICFAKRTLEIFDRLGCGERIAQKGISWNVGKVFYRDDMVYSFNLLPESGHRRPAFVNLQQYYVEGYLLDRALELPNLEVRWYNKVTGMDRRADCAELTVETPGGVYTLQADYVVAADGARSEVRRLCGLESKGRTFQDRFLIADVRMQADFPTERWFWFDPPFHRNQSVLLHRQPDNVWRVDFQLGWDADPVAARLPENVIPRLKALLSDVEFQLEWVSVYTFSCQRMDKFRHGRVFFAGDAAHRVSPFGARGANSGVQDAENLAWKLKLVLDGKAPDALLDSYGAEREYAADENLLNSTRATDFITPKSAVSRTFRDAALRLSKWHEFARGLVNSGRLSRPATLLGSALNTPDSAQFGGAMVPGAPVDDAPVGVNGAAGWFSACVGNAFTGVYFCGAEAPWEALLALRDGAIGIKPLLVLGAGVAAPALDGVDIISDSEGLLARRFDASPGSYYLLRPDQHVCARWRAFDAARVREALLRATGHVIDTPTIASAPCLAH